MARIITYECKQCGTEVVVTPTLESQLSPVYCCGMEVAEISGVQKKRPQPKKKSVKKPVKKTTKRAAPKKKSAKR